MMYDGWEDPNNDHPYYETPPEPEPLKPGDPGYRMAPWANDYNPGDNWNNGINTGNPGDIWNMNTNDYDPLVGLKKEQTSVDRIQRDPGPVVGPPPAPTGGGVRSINVSMPNSGINVPSATLPQDILDLFNKKPEMTPIQQAYQDALLKYMGKAQETPTLDDSILGPQTEVFRAANQRNTERQRRTAVERASAQGQNQSGYVDNLINEGVQKQGFNNAQFNANLLGGELNKRREELQAGLQLAQATGNQEATRELQARLAQVSAAMQQQGLNLQGQLGAGDLALRQLQTQLGNNQFYDQLGTNTALNLENLNQSALQKILAGLG